MFFFFYCLVDPRTNWTTRWPRWSSLHCKYTPKKRRVKAEYHPWCFCCMCTFVCLGTWSMMFIPGSKSWYPDLTNIHCACAKNSMCRELETLHCLVHMWCAWCCIAGSEFHDPFQTLILCILNFAKEPSQRASSVLWQTCRIAWCLTKFSVCSV